MRPPNRGRASTTATSMPPATSAVAAARPAPPRAPPGAERGAGAAPRHTAAEDQDVVPLYHRHGRHRSTGRTSGPAHDLLLLFGHFFLFRVDGKMVHAPPFRVVVRERHLVHLVAPVARRGAAFRPERVHLGGAH